MGVRVEFLALLLALPFAVATAQTSSPSNIVGASSAPEPIAFEVISIKSTQSQALGGSGFTSDGFEMKAIPPLFLISMAYSFKDFDRLKVSGNFQSWLVTDRYDVQAKVAEADRAQWQAVSPSLKKMAVQSLLEERFALKIHHEMKPGKIYELVVARGGPTMEKAEPSDARAAPAGEARLFGHGETMESLASYLPNFGVSRPVVDKTGLTGIYNFRLQLLPQEGESTASDSSIITDLRDQLGLELRPASGAVDYLVIDHIERPSPN